MAMTKALGANLQTGVTASGVSGVHEQTATRSSAGELVEIKDRHGNPLSVYVKDKHKEHSFEAVLEASVPDRDIGDKINIGGGVFVVSKWDVTESNDDVKKVAIAVRNYPGLNG